MVLSMNKQKVPITNEKMLPYSNSRQKLDRLAYRNSRWVWRSQNSINNISSSQLVREIIVLKNNKWLAVPHKSFVDPAQAAYLARFEGFN